MNAAMNTTQNIKEWIDDAILCHRYDDFVCPICGTEMIIKNGSIVRPHFAHKSLQNCDTFTHDMSDWHFGWQCGFESQYREVPIELTLLKSEYETAAYRCNFNMRNYELNYINPLVPSITIKHRADVCINGYVIEFQHSPISNTEFNERCWFYNRAGYKVVWIFDYMHEDIYCTKSTDYSDIWKWTRPKKTFVDFYAAGDFNRKNIFLFFQLDGNLLTKVVWSKPKSIYDEFGDYEYTESDFHCFSTYMRYDYTPDEFVSAINSRKIY